MEGSALKNLRMFQSLCGQKVLGNVFLTTTQWSGVNPAEAELRENRLRNQDFWGGLIDKGASLQRFNGTKESGLELIHKLMSNVPKPLDIQDQIVKQNKTLLETDAGKCIKEELIAQEKKHQEEVESLEKERQKAIKAKDDEMNEILAAEQAKAQKKLEEAAAERRLLEESHAAEVKKREVEARERQEVEERRRWEVVREKNDEMNRALEAERAGAQKKLEEEKKKQEEMWRRENSVIAVATKDISVGAHVVTLFGTYSTRGRWIFDINNNEEFEGNTFEVDIEYQVNFWSSAQIPLKTLLELGSEGMGSTNYIHSAGVRYVCQSGTPIKRGGRNFVIFRRG